MYKGEVPGRYENLARYLARYVVSPPISIRRINGYDGKTVRYHYRSHKTESVEEEQVDVCTFIGRMIQHILPKGFKRIRYYGVQATKTFEQVKGIIQSLVQGQESSEGGDKDNSAEEVSGEIYGEYWE